MEKLGVSMSVFGNWTLICSDCCDKIPAYRNDPAACAADVSKKECHECNPIDYPEDEEEFSDY